MEFTLLFAALTGVASAWLGLRIWRERLPRRSADLLIGAAVAGLVTGRITAMLVQGVNPITHPGDLIIVRGGVHTGAAVTGFVLSLLWVNRSRLVALDALAPSMLLGVAGWHAGCLWRDTCLGTPSDLPWAWSLDGSFVTRHPVELYASAALLVLAWMVVRLPWSPWLRFGVAMAGASSARLLTEPMRPSLSGGPIGWYLAGVVVGATIAFAGKRLIGAKHPVPT